MMPLVSVIIPCWNCADTLPLAIASLLAQTHKNWEAVIVDDGSAVPLRSYEEGFNDPRIKQIRLESNHGRGYAREAALAEAHGEYLALLDADDWYYPQKLQTQLECFVDYPEAVLVASALAVVDGDNKLVGIRGHRGSNLVRVFQPAGGLESVSIVHAPCMIRMSVAKAVGYDPTLRYSEDEDFLMRVTKRGPYVLMPMVLYAYSEIKSQSLGKQLRSYSATRRIFARHLKDSPVAATVQIAATWLKAAVYLGAYSLGVGDALVARRSFRPTYSHVQEFILAREVVLEKLMTVEPSVIRRVAPSGQ
jgi:glycosyltransferase involved in cell wall biosynthesis